MPVTVRVSPWHGGDLAGLGAAANSSVTTSVACSGLRQLAGFCSLERVLGDAKYLSPKLLF